jgi:hypothetical protein
MKRQAEARVNCAIEMSRVVPRTKDGCKRELILGGVSLPTQELKLAEYQAMWTERFAPTHAPNAAEPPRARARASDVFGSKLDVLAARAEALGSAPVPLSLQAGLLSANEALPARQSPPTPSPRRSSPAPAAAPARPSSPSPAPRSARQLPARSPRSSVPRAVSPAHLTPGRSVSPAHPTPAQRRSSWLSPQAAADTEVRARAPSPIPLSAQSPAQRVGAPPASSHAPMSWCRLALLVVTCALAGIGGALVVTADTDALQARARNARALAADFASHAQTCTEHYALRSRDSMGRAYDALSTRLDELAVSARSSSAAPEEVRAPAAAAASDAEPKRTAHDAAFAAPTPALLEPVPSKAKEAVATLTPATPLTAVVVEPVAAQRAAPAPEPAAAEPVVAKAAVATPAVTTPAVVAQVEAARVVAHTPPVAAQRASPAVTVTLAASEREQTSLVDKLLLVVFHLAWRLLALAFSLALALARALTKAAVKVTEVVLRFGWRSPLLCLCVCAAGVAARAYRALKRRWSNGADEEFVRGTSTR